MSNEEIKPGVFTGQVTVRGGLWTLDITAHCTATTKMESPRLKATDLSL